MNPEQHAIKTEAEVSAASALKRRAEERDRELVEQVQERQLSAATLLAHDPGERRVRRMNRGRTK